MTSNPGKTRRIGLFRPEKIAPEPQTALAL
jgi:hypothetical protein